ncbi:MAG: Acyltransferase family protein [uncultured Rubrobacteraceae bacterium]|uniref:Acyltransferase family protein n=1 Tax=uncultured Rubrobacteraceae bacterium TaxID=349277 RepID=A0A6J4Q0W6_9ACTN|nr:MAG: Acyltransferase family protein [uncultured Rubrobacteraceae bacterium]
MPRDLLPTDPTHDGRGTVTHAGSAPETGGHDNRPSGGVRLPYLPGLDGLRALAVIAVLLYHAELPWIRGGFLGVEVFFVISGYLITTLLLAEWHQQGRIDLVGFWLRRARRLLPALYLLLVVTLAFAVVFLPEEVARLRDDALAAFGYVTNWYLILGEQSYFETVGRPSLLQHLWSLAVEEQFYVLWPLLLTVALWGMAPMRRWRRRLALFMALAGAVGSALLMATLYQPGVDPSRVYYGTDTRVAGLLFGAALAFVWAPGRTPRWAGRRTRPLLLDVAGLAALGALVWFCLRLDQYQPFLFRGGFALVALATAVVILVAVNPHTHLGPHLLGWRPLRWIGLRSYGIYLWHWPVFMLTRPELDVPITGVPLLALRLAATIMLADLSYRFVETPLRTGALGRAWGALREARGARRWRLGAYWSGAVGTGATFCVVLGLALAHAQPPAPPSYLSAESLHTESSGVGESETAPAADVAAGTTKDPVTVVGDSVMLGSAGELERALGNPAFATDVGLQPVGVIEILKKRRTAGQLGEAVVVHAGDNVPFTAAQFDEMMGLLEDVPKVLIVNVKVPRPWEESNNEVLADGVRRYPDKAVLVDWHAASAGRPELFVEDGIHLQPEGQRVYADLIAAHLKAL